MATTTTTPSTPTDARSLADQCRALGEQAKTAARSLSLVNGEAKNAWLTRAAQGLRDATSTIIEANQRDLDAAPDFGLTTAAIDRLRLTSDRIEKMAVALDEVRALPDPVGEAIEAYRRPNGLDVAKVRVPLGVILMIYESRPNVTIDAAALCVKSGNAVILRGGKEAWHSNRALHQVLADALNATGLPEHAVQYVPTTDREAVGHLLGLADCIDLAIPRGGEGLIRRVAEQAKMPVLKHYQGNCHVYIDQAADPDMAEAITLNAKVQRPGVCNAAETLLIHREIAPTLLPRLAGALTEAGVELRGDDASRAIVSNMIPAQPEDWGTEFLDKILAVAVVDSLDDAIKHIERHGSGHTEAIVTQDVAAARRFSSAVDSSAVMINASPRYNDGGQLGLGAEIGISTDRFHARGPCGLRELTTTKWIVTGDGHVRT